MSLMLCLLQTNLTSVLYSTLPIVITCRCICIRVLDLPGLQSRLQSGIDIASSNLHPSPRHLGPDCGTLETNHTHGLTIYRRNKTRRSSAYLPPMFYGCPPHGAVETRQVPKLVVRRLLPWTSTSMPPGLYEI